MRAILAGALAVAIAGCVYSPEGSCATSADCASGEACDGRVCVAAAPEPGGVDPTSFTTLAWSRRDGKPDTAFAVDGVAADAQGDVIMTGAVSAPFAFDACAVAAGAFVVKLAAADGTPRWAVSLPTFSHGRLRAAVLPGGDVVLAGAAVDPTVIGTHDLVPPPGGALVVARLASADGTPRWARAVGGTHASTFIAPAAVAAHGTGVLVAGTGSGNFGCATGDTRDDVPASGTFVAALSADGACRWSRGLGTSSVSDVEAVADGDVAIGGVCTPSAATFDPGGGATCAKGLFVARLSGADGATAWARTTSGAGSISAVRDLAVAPDGTVTLVGEARGVVGFGGATVDFGATAPRAFAATFGPSGAPGDVLRPVEAPFGADPDALAFSRCAYDAAGALWVAGRYVGRPALGGIRFSACREPTCLAAGFLARVGAATARAVTSFLPLRAGPDPEGSAFVDDLALYATTGTVALAYRLTGASLDPAPAGTAMGGDLATLRVAAP